MGQSSLDRLEKELKLKEPIPAPPKPSPPQRSSEELPTPPVADSNSQGNKETTPEERTPAGVIFLGVEAASLGPDEIGVLVTAVIEDSPAWKSGIQIGDRLLGYNGDAISDIDDFGIKLRRSTPGQTVRFIVDRNGRNLTVPVVLQNLQTAQRIGIAETNELESPSGPNRSWLGCSVADLSETWRRQFSIPVYRGAAISDVIEDSPADAAGIKPGDVIIEIGGRAIESAIDLTQWLSEVRPGTAVKVSYFRGLTAKVSEISVGSIATPPIKTSDDPSATSNIPQDISDLPPQQQIDLLRAEILDTQQRLLEMQKQLDRLQRKFSSPR
jgi:predicted metalloprotease with PDZ domain